MLNIFSLRPDAFGLDVSDLSIKIAKLKEKNGYLSLSCFGEQEIKPGIIEEGEIKDEELVVKTIKEALSKTAGEKLKIKYIIASLPEEKAFLQVIQVPKMTEEELKKAIKFEAENFIPMPIKEVCLDFQVVKPTRDHLDHLDVLIAAFPRKTIDNYLSCFKRAGLIPLALEVESQAIARAVVKNEVSPFPILLIDLGAARTGFIIFSGYCLRFTSSIPVSSSRFTGAIAKNLNIDLSTAEKLKTEYGLETKNKKEGQAVFESLIPALTDLMEQIKAHLRYYQTHATHEHLPPGSKGVEKIFLCGGGANLKGLMSFISTELKIPVEIGNPWANILPEVPKEVPKLSFEQSLGYTTALGLALRGARRFQSKSD